MRNCRSVCCACSRLAAAHPTDPAVGRCPQGSRHCASAGGQPCADDAPVRHQPPGHRNPLQDHAPGLHAALSALLLPSYCLQKAPLHILRAGVRPSPEHIFVSARLRCSAPGLPNVFVAARAADRYAPAAHTLNPVLFAHDLRRGQQSWMAIKLATTGLRPPVAKFSRRPRNRRSAVPLHVACLKMDRSTCHLNAEGRRRKHCVPVSDNQDFDRTTPQHGH